VGGGVSVGFTVAVGEGVGEASMGLFTVGEGISGVAEGVGRGTISVAPAPSVPVNIMTGVVAPSTELQADTANIAKTGKDRIDFFAARRIFALFTGSSGERDRNRASGA